MEVDIMNVGVSANTGNIYPKDVLEKAIIEFNEKYSIDNQCLCCFDNNDMELNLEKVSHSVYDLYINDDGNVMATINILKTPNGKMLQSVIDSGVLFNTYSCGIGKISENRTISDYKFLRVNLQIQD